MLGVAVILATSITNESTIQAFWDMIDATAGKADFWIEGPSETGISEKAASWVQRIPGVAATTGGIWKESALMKGKSKKRFTYCWY